MGLSVRTDSYRYTEWLKWNGADLTVQWDGVLGVELYDHSNDTGMSFDSFENVNVAHQTEYAAIVKEHHALLLAEFHKP